MTKFKEKLQQRYFYSVVKNRQSQADYILEHMFSKIQFPALHIPNMVAEKCRSSPSSSDIDLAPISGRCRTKETLYFEKYIVRSIVSG